MVKFGQLVVCAAAGCAWGLKDFAQFFSTGHGGGFAVQSLIGLIVHRKKASKAAIAQAVGVLAYGVRLASFLALRARKPSYKKAVGDAASARTRHIGWGAKLATWASCSILYACMFTPTNAVLGQAAASSTAKHGLPLLFAGLLLEAESDRQKSAAKDADPDALVDGGLWSLSQHPNYLGEVTFWLGNWLAGLGATQTPGQRIAGAVGLLSIWGIIATESESQSKKQLDKYGSAAAAYQAKTPLLLPLPTRKHAVTMQSVPASEDGHAGTKEAAAPEAGVDAGIKAVKANADAEDAEHVAAELVKGAIHRVLASLAAEHAGSSEDVDEGQPKTQKPKKKKGGAKKGGKRK